MLHTQRHLNVSKECSHIFPHVLHKVQFRVNIASWLYLYLIALWLCLTWLAHHLTCARAFLVTRGQFLMRQNHLRTQNAPVFNEHMPVDVSTPCTRFRQFILHRHSNFSSKGSGLTPQQHSWQLHHAKMCNRPSVRMPATFIVWHSMLLWVALFSEKGCQMTKARRS